MKSYTIQRDATFVDDCGDVFELRKGDTFDLLNDHDTTPHINNRWVEAANHGSTLIGIGTPERAAELLRLCEPAPVLTPEPPMSGPAFAPGDLVQLVSGGPKMTVSGLRVDANGREWVDAVWFEQARGGLWDIGLIGAGSGSQLMRNAFDARMLRKVEPPTVK